MENMDDKDTVIAEEIVNLTEIAGRGDVLSVDVNEDHAVLTLVWEHPADFAPRPGASRWSPDAYERQEAGPTTYRFIETRNGFSKSLASLETRRHLYLAASFPGGRFLIKTWAIGGHDDFAHVIDLHGTESRAIRVGHSFPDIASSGRMWLTYGDQDDPEEGGIVCLDPAGRPLLKWNEHCDTWKLPWVFDCYAGNIVSDEEAWFWYLDHGFTLVRMAGLAVDRVWQDLPIEYSQAFAAAGDTVLFHGGYHHPEQVTSGNPRRDETHFHLVDLERMDYREFYPVNTDWRPLIPEGAFGRGPKLYFQDSGVLYAVDASKLSV